MGKTFSTGLLTDGISQDSSNNIGIGGATSGTNKFEVSGSTKLNGNTAITGSLSITGSATTIGNTDITGSLTVSSSANAIILPAGQTIGLGTAQIYTGTGGNSGNIFVQGTQTKLYADKVILEAATAAGVEVIGATKLSGSFIVSGSATTIGNTVLSGSLNVSGSITSTSTITAQTLVVQTITSSVLYSSGSNIFGNSLSNTQTFTGSVGMTGSLTLNNIAIPTSASLASTYLQLAGGTLTGALAGTTATFSGLVSGGNSSPSTSYNAGSWFTGDGLVAGNISSVSGIQLNSSPTSTLSAIRFGDGDGANNLYDQGFIIYRHTTDAMIFGTNRSTALTIASTGAATFSSSVTAGVAKLSTWATIGTFARFGHSSYDTGTNYGYLQDSAGNVYMEGTTTNISTTSGNTTTIGGKAIINGNVGIGTTTPDSKLHIISNAPTGTDNYALRLQNTTTVSDARVGISFLDNAQTGSNGSGATIQVSNNGVDGGGNLLFGSLLNGTNTERMRITSGGNVYIGATTASYPTLGYMLGVKATSGTQTYLSIAAPSQTLDSEGLIIGVDANSANIILRDNKYMVFFTNNTERMRITSAGNVTVSNLLIPTRLSLSLYSTLYGKAAVKGDNVSNLVFDLSTLFPEMSASFTGNVVGCFGIYTIFRSGAAETGMFSISRNSSSSWSSAAFSIQTATGTFSLGGVTGSGTTITMAFNTSVYVLVEVTAMVE